MKNALLFCLSIVLALILLPTGFAWGVVRCFWQRQFRSGLHNLSEKFLSLAKAIDKYGNVACREWFNDLLITRDSQHPFGEISQTISAVIGYNLMANTLTPLGRRVNGWLDLCFGKNHSRDAALTELSNRNFVHLEYQN